MARAMRTIFSLALLLAAVPTAAQAQLSPGVWTNTEDEYFAEEEGRTEPEWIGLEVGDDGAWRRIDAFGAPQNDWSSDAIPGLTPREGSDDDFGWQIDGSELRHARPFTCWISVRKFAARPDGSEDWTFQRGLEIFDQGGRILMRGEGDAPDVTIRLRNVTWARGSGNRPALVLYIHRDDPERAESYGWASPDATMVGINLRWVQASCSRAG